MKMMTIATIAMSALLLACGGGAGEANGSGSNGSEKAPVAVAAENSAATSGQTDATPSPKFKNGITDKNQGDKVGPVHLHGTVRGGAPTDMILYETEARNKSEIARTKITNGGAFDFGTLEVGRGVYILAYGSETNSTELILNPDEADLNITFNSNRLSGSKTADGSRENPGFWQYEAADKRNQQEVRQLASGLKDAGAFRTRIEQQIDDKRMELVTLQHELIDQYPDTYLAKLMSWKNPKFADDKGRFFEGIDPLDNSAVRSMAISDRIQQFMVTFSGGTDPGFLACIDLVKAHFEPNPMTLESALYSMLEGFYNTGKETICQYILDNYIFDEDCGADLSDAIRIRAEGIINLQVGKTPPNFRIQRFDGGTLDLMETCKANEYTLIMFWASWCHKCEQEAPYLGPIYAKYNFKGLEIVGISLDQQRDSWGKGIEEKGMTWPQVSQLQAWNSPVVKDYKVTATPTYFLLDKEGKIVLKPTRAFEVDNFLKTKL